MCTFTSAALITELLQYGRTTRGLPYAASYYGGQKEDYDVIKVEAGPYTINATDGNTRAWRELFNASRTGFESMESYQKVLGNNPDGSQSRLPGAGGSCQSDRLHAGHPSTRAIWMLRSRIFWVIIVQTFYSVRSRLGEMGFQHFVHDAEHTLLNVNENRLGPYNAGRSFTYFNPQYLWQRLQANEEFTLLIGDRIHRHLFNDGALTTEKATELFLRRKDQIDRAVVAESARWGDSKRALLLVTEWVSFH